MTKLERHWKQLIGYDVLAYTTGYVMEIVPDEGFGASPIVAQGILMDFDKNYLYIGDGEQVFDFVNREFLVKLTLMTEESNEFDIKDIEFPEGTPCN